MIIKTSIHTIFVLVGPRLCGKSRFANQLQFELESKLLGAGIPQESNRVVTISQMQIAREFGFQNHKPDSISLLSVEHNATELALAKLKAFTTFPSNAEFVIFDSSFMNQELMGAIRAIAEANYYSLQIIEFDYKDKSYVENLLEMYPSIGKRKLSNMPQYTTANVEYNKIRIFERDPKRWYDLKVDIDQLKIYVDSHLILHEGKELCVIGDIHEYVEPVKTLLSLINPDAVLVSVGDYLDKGGATEEVIGFMEKFVNKGGIIVEGNHEAYVAKRLRGALKNPDIAMEGKYLESISTFLANEALTKRFLRLYENHTLPFLKVITNKSTIFVTHAPCRNKHLGKLDKKSRKAQRNVYADRHAEFKEGYNFVFQEAHLKDPIHVFGHIAHDGEKMMHHNKVCVDTGSVYGGRLTGFQYRDGKFNFSQIMTENKSTNPKVLGNFAAGILNK